MTTKKIITLLDKPVAIEPLVVFRVVFGALMVFSTVRFMALGWVGDHYLDPQFHFKYFGFEWVEVLPPLGMYAIHVIMVVAALGVMTGLFYRLSAAVLFLTFTYTELVDLTYYLNHYYFVSVVSALMVVLPANRAYSLDVVRRPELKLEVVPQWCIALLKFQLAVVYFYAGVAKINYDWLFLAMPMKIWMPANDQLPLIGPLLALKFMPYVFSWAGMLYDCIIVFLLSFRQTRLIAYASVVFFHTVTGMMFQIGVFPLVMMGATLIFFPADFHKRIIRFMQKLFSGASVRNEAPVALIHQPYARTSLLTFLLTTFVIFQILFPWRYLLYPGNLFWSEEGYRFSWRVMLVEKAGTATFYVKDGGTGREGIVDNREFLNAHQEKQMSMQPDMILQYARFLRDHYASKGMQQPEVRAEVYVTMNARPSQLLIDPQVNLAALEDGWAPKPWIKPYKE